MGLGNLLASGSLAFSALEYNRDGFASACAMRQNQTLGWLGVAHGLCVWFYGSFKRDHPDCKLQKHVLAACLVQSEQPLWCFEHVLGGGSVERRNAAWGQVEAVLKMVPSVWGVVVCKVFVCVCVHRTVVMKASVERSGCTKRRTITSTSSPRFARRYATL